MADERIVIKSDLGIQGKQPSIGSGDKWIDLAQGSVSLFKSLVETSHETYSLIDRLRFQAQAKSQLARMERLKSNRRINMLHQDCLGIFRRNFLNFHPARYRRHKDRTRCSAVHHNAQVKLTLNRQGLFNQQPLYDLSFRPGLV